MLQERRFCVGTRSVRRASGLLETGSPDKRIQGWLGGKVRPRVISTKKEALQALSIPKNVTRNSLTFRAKEIGQSVGERSIASMSGAYLACAATCWTHGRAHKIVVHDCAEPTKQIGARGPSSA